MSILLTSLGFLTSRMVSILLSLAIWLIARPGGWAVLALAVLIGVKLLPGQILDVTAFNTQATHQTTQDTPGN